MPYTPQSASDVVLLFEDGYTPQDASDVVLLFGDEVTPPASDVVFRKTLSTVGARVGSRQVAKT